MATTTDLLSLQGDSIKEFYRGCSVFVTGGTGFLGKVLIEKILRSCVGVDKVYMLLRPKKGRTCEERMAKFRENNIFDVIRKMDVSLLEKMVGVAGDICDPFLGLSESDRIVLASNVSIVFHSAATVRFDEPFDVAANMNIFGTKRVLDLALEMKKLKSFVYVSTAYSNSNQMEIDERIYHHKRKISLDTILECMEKLPGETSQLVAEYLQGKMPNTYTMSKCLAEQLVEHYEITHRLPICIVRPSMVVGCYKEPIPGWVDNFNGLMVLAVEMGRGTIQIGYKNEALQIDIVPVDICCNMLLVCAWYTVHRPSPTMRVFNCTSGAINPVTWGYASERILAEFIKCPSKYQIMYPTFSYTNSRIWFLVNVYFYHLFIVFLADGVLCLTGNKPRLFQIARTVKSRFDLCRYFAENEWKFEVSNVLELMSVVKRDVVDSEEFCCDIKTIDWKLFAKNFIPGIRKYLLRDEESTIPAALQKQKFLFVVKWIIHALQLWLVYAVFKAIFNCVFA